MRKILFRGQQRKKGEKVSLDGNPLPPVWFHGGVLQGDGDHSIIYDAEGKHPVYTDTLCEYSGFDDTNGNPIFEGDVIRVTASDPDAMCEEDHMVVEDNLVIWNQIEGCWELLPCSKGLTPSLENCGFICESAQDDPENYRINVIGNRFDNPELIPEGADLNGF